MPVSPACIAAVRAASGDRLTDAEATDLIRRAEQRRDKLRAAGKIDDLEARLRAEMAGDADKARIAAAVAQKQAYLAAIAFSDALDHIETVRTTGRGMDYRKAALAFLEGTTRLADEGRNSLAATAMAYRARYAESFNLALVRDAEVAKLVQHGDRNFSDAVVHEMGEIRDGGQPGITGNRQAQELAQLYAKIADQARTDANRMGATIGKLDGWSPQKHDSAKVARASFEEWRDFIAPRLDRDRTFGAMSDAGADDMLRSIHREIVTGVARQPSAAEAGQRVGPANLANRLGESRTLHFQDKAAWLQYAERFGDPNIHAAMLGHISHMARANALLDRLGPNPESTWQRVLATLQRQAANDSSLTPPQRAEMAQSLDPAARFSSLSSAWAEASGLTSSPGNIRWAQIGSSVRQWMSLSKLMGAVVSSVSDLATRQSSLIYQGMPIGRALAENAAELLRGKGAGELREISAVLDAGVDGIKGHIVAASLAEDMPMGMLHRWSNAAFRWQGMTWWQDAQKAGAARMLARWMGYHAETAWDGLSARYTVTMRQHGITPEMWDAVRGLAREAEDGNRYITPDLVQQLDDAALARIAGDRLAAAGPDNAARVLADTRLDVELTLRRFFADEMGFAYLETDAASRRLAFQGTQPGTVLGEAARLLMQFKGFPIAFTQRNLGRAFLGYSAEERMLQARNLGVLIAGTTALGILAMTVKDAVRGYGPRDWDKPKTWLAAMTQGGGLGLYGDYLFAQSSRFGNSVLESVAGPTAGTAANLVGLFQKARDGDAKVGDALNLALQNTPFINLWYTRPALDLLILNSLRETVSPGFLQRQHQRRFDDFGQRPIGHLLNSFM